MEWFWKFYGKFTDFRWEYFQMNSIKKSNHNFLQQKNTKIKNQQQQKRAIWKKQRANALYVRLIALEASTILIPCAAIYAIHLLTRL